MEGAILSGTIHGEYLPKVHQITESQNFIQLIFWRIILTPSCTILNKIFMRRQAGRAVKSEVGVGEHFCG